MTEFAHFGNSNISSWCGNDNDTSNKCKLFYNHSLNSLWLVMRNEWLNKPISIMTSFQTNEEQQEKLECVFPYVRDPRKVVHQPETAKFIHNIEHKSKKVEEITNPEGKTTKCNTTITKMQEKKETLKICAQSPCKDLEHF